jgi:hypothetical protein
LAELARDETVTLTALRVALAERRATRCVAAIRHRAIAYRTDPR